jgi:hypothetical protein
MADHLGRSCELHTEPFDCPDCVIHYSPKFDEYGLVIHDGGSSTLAISFCPWCGARLPESKRDLWFEKLEALGFSDPFSQEIPAEFKSDEWYRCSSLETPVSS